MGGSERVPAGGVVRLRRLQQDGTSSTKAAWEAYSSYASGAVNAVLPAHTKRALSECAAELSDDSAPKDLSFLLRHGQALKPRTGLGWVGLAAVGTCGFSVMAVMAAGTLMISIGGLATLGVLLALGGSAIATALGLMAMCLLLSSIVAGMLAAGAASTYASLAATRGTLRLVGRLLASPDRAAAQEMPAPRQAAAQVAHSFSEQPAVPVAPLSKLSPRVDREAARDEEADDEDAMAFGLPSYAKEIAAIKLSNGIATQ